MRIDGIYFCGASIIDNRHLLTAAHCVDGTQRLQLHFGAQNINNYTEPGQVLVFQGSSYTLHPSWDPQTLNGDIAIIRLDNGLEFNGINEFLPVILKCSIVLLHFLRYRSHSAHLFNWSWCSDLRR